MIPPEGTNHPWMDVSVSHHVATLQFQRKKPWAVKITVTQSTLQGRITYPTLRRWEDHRLKSAKHGRGYVIVTRRKYHTSSSTQHLPSVNPPRLLVSIHTRSTSQLCSNQWCRKMYFAHLTDLFQTSKSKSSSFSVKHVLVGGFNPFEKY